MTEYGTDNFIELESMNPFVRRYLFVDTTRQSSDEVFSLANVPIRIFDRLKLHDDSPFSVVQCHVKKKHDERFKDCMADLERKILLSGHTEYAAYCTSLKESLSSYEPYISFF